MTIVIRPAQERDHLLIHAINEDSVPHVTSIPMEELQTLARQSSYFSAAWVEHALAGFLLALRPGQDYSSPHYQWFSQHYPNFVYVDRIAVSPHYKGVGIGRALYTDLENAVRGTTPLITCEVNLLPPNPDSVAFHKRLGFEEVGQLESEGGEKRVSLMAKKIA